MKILIVDDEKIFASQIARKLRKNNYEVDLLHYVQDLKSLENLEYDMFLLDISLSDGSGFDMISFLRDEKNIATPIIIISGYSHVDRKVK